MIEETWSDSTGSYIRIHGDDKERISDRILSRGCVQGILPLEIEWVNGARDYIYETTGYQSVIDWLRQGHMSSQSLPESMTRKDKGGEDSQSSLVIQILQGIIDIVDRLEKYLLEGEYLVIEPDTLFYDDKNRRVGAIYLPEKSAGLSAGFIKLTEAFIKNNEGHDRHTAEFLYRLHGVVVGGGCDDNCPDMVREFLAEESGTTRESIVSDRAFGGRAGSVHSESESAYGRITKRFRHMEKVRSFRAAGARPERSGSGISRAFFYWILPALPLLAGVLIPVILTMMGVFTEPLSGHIDSTKMIAAFVFFVVVGGYGAARFAPHKGKKRVVWKKQKDLSVCLLPGTVGLDVMAVTSFPWKIGRDEERVDSVIRRDGISELHAHIKREGDAVFLTDDESLAGTYHNNRRLAPYECVRLADGDTVSFDTASYVVEIGEG